MRDPYQHYLDLSKAFDTLNHDILLHKLEHYGVRDSSLDLFNNYLTNRKQYVEYDDVNSDILHISTGVPQGSILGPLLFIIYINDMPKVSKILSFIMYADNTTLSSILKAFQPYTTTYNIDELINSELRKVSEWLIVNKLSLNVSKTKFSLFHTKRKNIIPPIIIIQNVIIEQVQDFDFLGLIINENLNWKSHCDKIANNISKVVGVINRLKHFLPETIRILLYNSKKVSLINYCILAWGYEYSRIFKLQKKLFVLSVSVNIMLIQNHFSNN